MKVLLAYATSHGSSTEIAQWIGRVLQEKGLTTTVAKVEEINTVEGYDACILGSPIYAGAWLPELTTFLTTFAKNLAAKPLYLWVACIRVMEENGVEHVLEFYLNHDLLRDIRVREATAFSGKLNLSGIDWNERWTLAARYDGGTWPSSFDGDFRDWEKIRAWAEKVADELAVQG